MSAKKVYYNRNNLRPIWKHNMEPLNKDRCKKRYFQAPKPGRKFQFSITLKSILKKLGFKKDSISKLDFIKVNEQIVKDLRHPISVLDYLEYENELYRIEPERIGQKKILTPRKYTKKKLEFFVLKHYLKGHDCKLNTFQNKIFTFKKDPSLFEKLKSFCLIRKDLKSQQIQLKQISFNESDRNFYNLLKLTGKDSFKLYKVVDFKIESLFYNLKLQDCESKGTKEIKIEKSIFFKKYVILENENLEQL